MRFMNIYTQNAICNGIRNGIRNAAEVVVDFFIPNVLNLDLLVH